MPGALETEPDPSSAEGVFDRIRSACRTVAEGATWTRIAPQAVWRMADRLAAEPGPAPFAEEHFVGDPVTAVAYALTWDSVNYGSGWFPVIDKLAPKSGSRTLMTRLQAQFARHGPWAADELAGIGTDTVAGVFGQAPSGAAGELMASFAESWRQLGRWLCEDHDGSFTAAVEAADGSAARLVVELGRLDHFADVHRWRHLAVPLYKRAQITVSDLRHGLAGQAWGRFTDIDELTLFADNLVPHVLRWSGVLVHHPDLARRIEAGELLASGEEAEVELRAVAVHAAELVVAELAERGVTVTAADVDHRLWRMGQEAAVKATPRHRCRCTYY